MDQGEVEFAGLLAVLVVMDHQSSGMFEPC